MRIDRGRFSGKVRVFGKPLTDAETWSAEALTPGIPVELSGCVLVLLHHIPGRIKPEEQALPTDRPLLGESRQVRTLRSEIRRVADLETCVLIRGETGTGKELVARAIHLVSPRRAAPYVAVNLAAIPETTAASALFGHVRGSFTGALQSHTGYFVAAEPGTLFLDELGETTKAVQSLLLRAIREGEIQQVGATEPRKVNVRLLAATDTPLEQRVAAGEFSEPLLHRVEAFTITVPALRERQDDVARLFFHFLAHELAAIGEQHKLKARPDNERPWLPARFIGQLVAYGWPGNVAELQTVARRVAIANRGLEKFCVDEWIKTRLETEPGASIPPSHKPAEPRKDARELDEAELVAAMHESQFVVRAAAERLGVSRSWLHTRLEFCSQIRQAKDLTTAEIEGARAATDGSAAAMARHLEVSEHGLKLRLKALT